MICGQKGKPELISIPNNFSCVCVCVCGGGGGGRCKTEIVT